MPNEIDLIAASFVRKGSDLDYIRQVRGGLGWRWGWVWVGGGMLVVVVVCVCVVVGRRGGGGAPVPVGGRLLRATAGGRDTPRLGCVEGVQVPFARHQQCTTAGREG